MREILVAVEDSEKSKRVSDFVNHFFADLDVSITAVNVGRVWHGGPAALPRPGRSLARRRGDVAAGDAPAPSTDLRAAAVDTAERAVESSGLRADDHVVEAGDHVADTLRRIAAERDVDVIVVGASHKSLLERLLTPSVATDLAKAASRPVLVVH